MPEYKVIPNESIRAHYLGLAMGIAASDGDTSIARQIVDCLGRRCAPFTPKEITNEQAFVNFQDGLVATMPQHKQKLIAKARELEPGNN